LYQTPAVRQTTRDGITFELDLSNYNDYFVFYGLTEPGLVNLFSLIKPGYTVLDVGANIGFTTLQFSKRCYPGIVHAYEPASPTFEKLKKNISLNEVSNITLQQVGIGDEAGTRRLEQPNRLHSGMNRILKESGGSDFEDIKVIRLDDDVAISGMKRIDLIKIDVEGYEWYVLQGGLELIRRHKPILFVEVNEANLRNHHLSAEQLLQLMMSLGYRLVDARTMTEIGDLKKIVDTDVVGYPMTEL
jgi:FkbM family methyltransferase